MWNSGWQMVMFLLGIDNRDDKDQVKIKDNIKPSTHPLTLLHHADYHVSHRADFSEKMFSSCGKKIQRSLHITQHQSHSTSKTCRSNSISSCENESIVKLSTFKVQINELASRWLLEKDRFDKKLTGFFLILF